VVVVPLLVGSGTRIKIFEAMAMEKAVVSTTLGAEGLKVNPDEHIFLADSPGEFAKAVHRLLGSPDMRRRMGTAARRLVRQHFSSGTVARQFERICLATLQHEKTESP